MTKRRRARRDDSVAPSDSKQQGQRSNEESPRRASGWLLGGGAIAVAVVLVVGFVVLAAPGEDSTAPIVSTYEGSVAQSAQTQQADRSTRTAGGASIGTAVGDRPPDFEMVGINGRTVSRESLLGSPSLLWFTTSYCLPCAEGALRLQDVLDKVGSPADELEVVIVFVDGGDPPEALEDWQNRYGRPEWTIAYSTGSMIRDFRLAYLDTKYLVGRDGVIDVTDFIPLQTDPWERDLRAALADTA